MEWKHGHRWETKNEEQLCTRHTLNATHSVEFLNEGIEHISAIDHHREYAKKEPVVAVDADASEHNFFFLRNDIFYYEDDLTIKEKNYYANNNEYLRNLFKKILIKENSKIDINISLSKNPYFFKRTNTFAGLVFDYLVELRGIEPLYTT